MQAAIKSEGVLELLKSQGLVIEKEFLTPQVVG